MTQLGRTADGMRSAYLTLKVEGTSMTSTDVITSYSHLQVLRLRGNELTDVESLRDLRSLIELDVSANKLTQVSVEHYVACMGCSMALHACMSLHSLSELNISANKLAQMHVVDCVAGTTLHAWRCMHACMSLRSLITELNVSVDELMQVYCELLLHAVNQK